MSWDRRIAAARLRLSYETDLGAVRAFLPDRVPLDRLPLVWRPYLQACRELPRRYPAAGGGVRTWLDRRFPHCDDAALASLAELDGHQRDRLMTALSALAHTYRWNSVPPVRDRFEDRRLALPPGISRPWRELAMLLHHPCVGTTWSLHLCNWRIPGRPGGSLYDPGELTAARLRMADRWLSGPVAGDLERFSLTFVAMEAKGAAVLRAVVEAVEAAAWRREADLGRALAELRAATEDMARAFLVNIRKAHVGLDVWLELIQPTFAWQIETHEGTLEGPSGMQLGTIQVLDAVLGLGSDGFLPQASRQARRYLPLRHQRFLAAVDEVGDTVARVVRGCRSDALTRDFNECLRWLMTFRSAHAKRGAAYLEAGRSGDHARISTGLNIPWRTNDGGDRSSSDDPVATFRRAMAERVADTADAMVRDPPAHVA